MVHVTGFLLLTWGTWIEFLPPGSQLWLLVAFQPVQASEEWLSGWEYSLLL